MENDRKPSFIGEGLIRKGATKTMAHPMVYEEIIQRSDYKAEKTMEGQDKIIAEISWKARQERARVYTTFRLQELQPHNR